MYFENKSYWTIISLSTDEPLNLFVIDLQMYIVIVQFCLLSKFYCKPNYWLAHPIWMYS